MNGSFKRILRSSLIAEIVSRQPICDLNRALTQGGLGIQIVSSESPGCAVPPPPENHHCIRERQEEISFRKEDAVAI